MSSWGSTETQMLMYLIYVYPHRLHKTSSSQKWKSIFSFLLGPLPHSLYGKWAFCCPFNAIIGAVQSSALWAEASALHWVSGHTLQSKCCAPPRPPSAITPPLLFYHCGPVIQSWRRAGTREQANKQADRGWNHGGITEPEAHSLPAFSFSVKWKSTTHKSDAFWNVHSIHFHLKTACFSHAVAFCFQIAHSIHQTKVTHW